MNVGSSQAQKKAALFGSGNSPLAASPGKRGRSTTSRRRCCRGFNDCIIMGSNVPHNHLLHNQPSPNHELQVKELQGQVEKEREIRGMLRLRLERTQDYLRYCLQVAQDNGFLEVLINKKENQQQSCHAFLSSNVVNISPPPVPSPPVHQHFELANLAVQAKTNGWYIQPHEIEMKEQVGQGSTADIYKGTWRGDDVAVKCIYPDFFISNDNGVTFFAQEVETLSRQRHRFVLQLRGACLEPPDHGWVVTEFLSMTLKEWLHGPGNNRRKERKVPLPPLKERVSKALEVAQGMQYLHEQNPKVIHRDLKPSNIFLDDANHVRIADFGHARFLSDEEKALTGETGTYVYMAPEVFRSMPYEEKCDIFSFGIIMNELITGDFPYIETDYGPCKIAMQVAEGTLRPSLPNNHDGQLGELIDLIRLSWDDDAYIRPTFATITCTLREVQKKLMETI